MEQDTKSQMIYPQNIYYLQRENCNFSEETKKPVDETDKSLFCSLTKSPCHSKVEWSSP